MTAYLRNVLNFFFAILVLTLLLFATSMATAHITKAPNSNNAHYNETYRAKIRTLYDKDQAIRTAAYKSTAEMNKALKQYSPIENKVLKTLITQYGWPTYTLVGKDASDAAFVLIIHQDSDPDFQKHALKATLPLVKAGEMSAYWHGYLYDRVMTNEGKKQLFGTQGHCVSTGPQGQWQPFPINNKTVLDQRRQQAGMTPESQYIKVASQAICQQPLHFKAH